jgi:NAD(P)-dependent dehydrogenase (short-subunit alcohol dehydrogenase family)
MAKFSMEITKHTVVFGGSGDIGMEIVRSAVDNGVKRISFTYGGNKAAADALAAELRKRKVKVFCASVKPSDKKAVNAFLEEAVMAQGEEVNHMVYAIGISPNKSYLKQTLETTGPGDDIGAREIFEINALGSDICCRATAERMVKKKVKGTIVTITSSNGYNSYAPISAPYDASKIAQSKLMRIASEVFDEFGIRINGCAPGWIKTKMNLTLKPAYIKQETKRIGIGRWAEPYEVAAVVIWLLSSASSFVYGQDIIPDGNYRA